ncbi:MAG: mechanosensitive ion channel family protein [Proteobacteria bacterium]|nr:mechanosensitive ion channel family protein [Pseudomonadota bacterium]MBU1689051.1 mechanosensitive ion channel family protein [Pseudomonadota bacterium]
MESIHFEDFVVGQGPKLLFLLLLVVAGIIVYLSVSRFVLMLYRRNAISESFSQVFKNITKFIILVTVFLFTLQQLGVTISTIVASLLTMAAMIAIGFIAVWSVLSNFLCSFLVILFTPFRIGDEIEITEVVGGPGLRGRVVDFNMMYTAILESGVIPEEERALIRIPNNTFFQKAIKRWKGDERKSIEKYLLDKSLSK